MSTAKGRAAVMERPGKITIQEFDIPDIEPAEALLKVEMAGVCVSDSKRYDNLYKVTVLPLIMGHENHGVIYKIGDEMAAASGLKVGDRVALEPGVPCGQCRYCRDGETRFCEKKSGGYGVGIPATRPPHFWGGYAEFIYLRKGVIMKRVSSDVPTEAVVLLSPLANAIYWIRTLAGCHIGDNVVIQGVGPQGLCAILAARESGAMTITVTGLEWDKERFELARVFGATHCINVEREKLAPTVREITGGDMADIVLDVTGSPAGLQNSLEIVKKMGTIVSAGVTGTDTRTPLLMDKVTLGQVRIQGAFSKDSKSRDIAIKLLESRKYPVEKMVTHKYKLEQTEEALKVVGGHSKETYPVKAAIEP